MTEHPTTEVSETVTDRIVIKDQITDSEISRALRNLRIIVADSEITHPTIQTAVSGIIRLITIPIAEDSGIIPGRRLSKVLLSQTPIGIRTGADLDKTIINKKTDS